MGAGVGGGLVEAHAGDRAGEVGVNFTPSSTAPLSPASTVAGVAKSKIVASGVTALEAADGAPVPTAFVAVTLNV